MTAKELDFIAGELAESQEAEERRREEVRARTVERLKAINAEYADKLQINEDDFWEKP